MKKIMLMALLVGVAMFMKPQEAKASTPITCGATISTQDAYYLSGNVLTWDKTVNGPCLTITVNSPNWTLIDCQGHTIQVQEGSSHGLSQVDVILFSHASHVALYDCIISQPDVVPGYQAVSKCIDVTGNASPSRDSSWIEIEYNVISSCRTQFNNTDYAYFNNNTVTDGEVDGADVYGFYVQSNTIDNSASANNVAGAFVATITVGGYGYELSDNTLKGILTTSQNGIDDLIILAASTYGWIHNNTMSGFNDLAVEWLDTQYHVEIEYNTVTGSSTNSGAFGCYYRCAIDTFAVENNTASSVYTLVNMAYGTGSDVYLNSNSVTSLSTGGSSSWAGFNTYASGHPLTLVNNYFDQGVHFASSSNVVDGGGNHCDPSHSTPSPLPITCTWP